MPKPTKKTPLEFPQSADIWYFAIRKLRAWITPEGEEPVRPYLIITLNLSTGMILDLTVGEKPDPQKAKDTLFAAITRPQKKLKIQPQRPTWIFFEERELLQALTPALQEISVETKHSPQTEYLDEIVKELEAHLRGDQPEISGLLAGKKVTAKMVGNLFEAAADFFRAAPWVQLANEDVLAIRIPPQNKPFYVTVMGQGGVEYGLALYKHWADVEQMYGPHDHPLETLPPGGSHSLLFNEITEVPFDDLEAIEKYGWVVAGPQAYPVPIIFVPPDQVRRPEGEEISWYEAALRAIPEFIQKHWTVNSQGEALPVEGKILVMAATGQVTVEIKYPAGELPLARRQAVDQYPLEGKDELALPFDRRSMEGDMARMFGRYSDRDIDPKQEKAQELMYSAWEERNPAKRITLAHKALKISRDCADAYVLLAEEEADTVQRALEHYQEGVKAGERALGQEYFKENIGHFWGLLETRPYMRALEGAASCLWQMGHKEEALQIYQRMLRLNPGDNQGIRYFLVDLLLTLNRERDLEKLLKKFKGDWTAVWLYTTALLAFRKGGSSENADKHLRAALGQNHFVPEYLTGKKRVHNQLPDYIGIGDDKEAAAYAANHLNYWRQTPGAVEWLHNMFSSLPPAKASEKPVVEKSKKTRRGKSGL